MPTNSVTLRPDGLLPRDSETRAEELLRSPASPKRIPELDGLRGLAILLVIFCHFGYETNSAAGHRWLFYLLDTGSLAWSGVDLFFVLSGFLIGGILLDARNSPNYFKAFYARRVFRIIPIYAVVVGVFYLCVFTGVPGRMAGSRWLFGPTVPGYAYATFTQNVGYALAKPNFAYWLSSTWSLAVEEQFYLLLPLTIWFVSRRRLPYLLGFAIVAAPALRLFLNLHFSWGRLASFYLMPCRADSLLLGVTAALWVRHPSIWESLKRGRRRLALFCMVMIAGLPLFILLKATDPTQSFWMSTVGLSWMAVMYLCLLLLALVYSDGWVGSKLRNSGLRALGTISYGVYLFHMPVLGLTFMIFRSKRPWAETPAEHLLVLVATAFTIAAASISWTFFEKPLLKIGHTVKY
jgi:peptidoglycan/LPS O-acetylase OafA/YrhL